MLVAPRRRFLKGVNIQKVLRRELGGGNSNIFYVHPYLGKISNLINIFQMGWNHQPEKFPEMAGRLTKVDEAGGFSERWGGKSLREHFQQKRMLWRWLGICFPQTRAQGLESTSPKNSMDRRGWNAPGPEVGGWRLDVCTGDESVAFCDPGWMLWVVKRCATV